MKNALNKIKNISIAIVVVVIFGLGMEWMQDQPPSHEQFFKAKEKHESIMEFEKSDPNTLKNHPDFCALGMNYAVMLARTGQASEAFQLAEYYIKKSPSGAHHFQYLVQRLSSRGENEYAEEVSRLIKQASENQSKP
jgi:hypothetical protein